ncbi:AraC family transcriptional regulator [Pedobacter sp. HMWF019]|uniref:AraC family transcriptional regulator n=1 Tax=Pedobacter sp. HMWF019 TaxID=2056856 RepID=UPI000D3A9DC2|nr:AraC family transcriptional regulator [Pedobacter sp. HMWF019]PTS94275.1 AraC family transcriptional regulator [Pedobacter sp. HMWF019]
MERFIQHDALYIRHFTTTQWPFPVHNHNHFELAFIHSGNGFHYLNEVPQWYQGPCLFLLSPEDYHIFEIQDRTEFSILKFTNIYLDGPFADQGLQEWSKLMEQLLAMSSTLQSCLVNSAEELFKIEQLIRLIIREWETSQNSGNETIFYLVRAVFSLIKKTAVKKLSPKISSQENTVMSIVNYIHKQIRNPRSLQLKELAEVFNFSPNYLTGLFKKQMGVPIKTYIDNYKLKLIENKLKYTEYPLKEISIEFGFNDLSHFNKFFKKNYGTNPKEAR